MFTGDICNKVYQNEAELGIHKKRHKAEAPLVCNYCSRQYTDRHRYEVHVRFHTGETPFKCPICNKGFRDSRKQKIHVRRHNGTLAHKCHLCPRSFEGKKNLEKHLNAHENNRCVETKVIKGADGSFSMALPDDKKRSLNNAINIDVDIDEMYEDTTAKDQKITPLLTLMTPNSQGVESNQEEEATISLSVDDLMQYAQPMAGSAVKGHPELEERYAEVTNNKFLPVGMEEFVGQKSGSSKISEKDHDASNNPHNDSGEFPDLLDCESNLATISDKKFDMPSNSTPPQERVQDDTGLTFTMLSGVKPEYPQNNDLNKQPSNPLQHGGTAKPNIVIAKKSTAPTPPSDLKEGGVSDSNKSVTLNIATGGGNVVANATDTHQLNQLGAQSQISLPAGTCIIPAGLSSSTVASVGAHTISSAVPVSMAPNQSITTNPMTITLQYKVYSGEKDQLETVAVKRDLADLINEAPSDLGQSNVDLDSSGRESSTPTITGTQTTSVSEAAHYDPSSLPPLPVENNDADLVLKDTVKVKNSSGESFDVPTVVTGGYCLDSMLCNICDKSFKNDKTLMGHMINHFGITPKMAKCPICGLTLQKKSYARHLRLHGDIVPEVCRYLLYIYIYLLYLFIYLYLHLYIYNIVGL